MPLGGLDTGCLDIEPNGMLGYSTIFNHLVQPRALLNLPFLGLHCKDDGNDGRAAGKTWVLVSDTVGKEDTPRRSQSIVTFPPTDYTPHFSEIGLKGVATADFIDYWGHYPIVDLEFATAAPVTVGVRAWSPFIPGDIAASLTPGAVFAITVRNPDRVRHAGTIAFSFPGFTVDGMSPDADTAVERQTLTGALNGVLVKSARQGDAWEMAYVLAAIGPASVKCGGALNADGRAWMNMAEQLPLPSPGDSGASLTLDFDLAAGESHTVQVVLAWHAPYWRAGGSPASVDTNLFTHMYAAHHPDAVTTAHSLASEHATLLGDCLARGYLHRAGAAGLVGGFVDQQPAPDR
jgi:hypothetical protein